MTDAEVEQEIKEFIIYWAKQNVVLPNPDNYPRCFQYYVKLWRSRDSLRSNNGR